MLVHSSPRASNTWRIIGPWSKMLNACHLMCPLLADLARSRISTNAVLKQMRQTRIKDEQSCLHVIHMPRGSKRPLLSMFGALKEILSQCQASISLATICKSFRWSWEVGNHSSPNQQKLATPPSASGLSEQRWAKLNSLWILRYRVGQRWRRITGQAWDHHLIYLEYHES